MLAGTPPLFGQCHPDRGCRCSRARIPRARRCRAGCIGIQPTQAR